MPITFQQPSPQSGSISIGAGRADVNTKEFAALAGLVESYGRLAAQAYGRGGGGGGGGSSGGPVQVLPSGQIGAVAISEGNADREQSALNLGATLRNRDEQLRYSLDPANDPVARHIQMQEAYQDRRQLQAQQANEQAKQRAMSALVGREDPNGAQGKAPPAPTWEIQDEQDLVAQRQIIRKVAQDQESGKLKDPDAILQIQGQAMQKIAELHARKKAATEQAQADQEQQQMRAQQILVGQQDRLTLETRKIFRKHGEDGIVDKFDPKTGEYVGSLQWNPKTQTMEPIKELGPKAKAAPEKEEKTATDSQMLREAKALAESTVPFNKDKATFDAAIHAETQKNFGEMKLQQKQKVEAKDTAKRMKEADPKAVEAFATFTSAIPKNEAGQVDLNRATIQQLQVLGQAMGNPKRLGLTPEDAARKKAVIFKAIQDKLNPQQAKPIATPDPKSAMQNSADAKALLPGGGGFDIRSLWK